MEDWEALVIGDACTDDTADRIAALGDPRIRFINLPARFGEQAGPNSVGSALARAPVVAFLNHDDLWFPDHLARALDALNQSRANLYWSRAAFFANRGAWSDRTFFTEVSPTERRLNDIYYKEFFYAEPLSTWVIRKDALDRLGPMKPASQTPLFPLTDYTMRAARLGLQLQAGAEITVLKDRMLLPQPAYANPGTYAEKWARLFETGDAERVRAEIERDIWLASALGLNRSFDAPPVGNCPANHATIEQQTGLNLAQLNALARGEKAALLTDILHHRTGDTLTDQPDLSEMIRFARDADQ